MKTKLLGGLVLALALSSGAWADQKNTFSDSNTIKVDSNAAAAASGSASATANSNSYNTSLEGVVNQELHATVADTTTAVHGDGRIINGHAIATTSEGNRGIVQTGANSGVGAIMQQGIAVGVAGAVKQ